MAITKGNTSTNNTTTSATNDLSTSHTVANNPDRLLVAIGAGHVDAGGTIESMTWNGTPMAPLWTAGNGAQVTYGVFYLVNPEAGTYNVVIHYSSSQNQACAIIDFYGVNQTTPLNTENKTAFATGTAATATYTGASDQYPLAFLARQYSNAITSDAGQTRLATANSTRSTDSYNAIVAIDTDARAASVTSGFSWANNRYGGILGVSLLPSPEMSGTQILII